MTQRILIPNKVSPSGDPVIDSWLDRDFNPLLQKLFTNMVFVLGNSASFTATLQGSGTAGTYEIGSQASFYYRVGDLVYALIDITLDSSITAGGTGNLQISGLPYTKMPNHYPIGSVYLSGVDLAPGVHVVSVFDSDSDESTVLELNEITDNSTPAVVPISAVAATDRIVTNIVYVTSG